jgi:hypothetical protein
LPPSSFNGFTNPNSSPIARRLFASWLNAAIAWPTTCVASSCHLLRIHERQMPDAVRRILSPYIQDTSCQHHFHSYFSDEVSSFSGCEAIMQHHRGGDCGTLRSDQWCTRKNLQTSADVSYFSRLTLVLPFDCNILLQRKID